MRNPYWIRLRGTGNGERKFGGPDHHKGVEVLVATEQGAIIVRVKRDERGIERTTVSLIPWTDWKGDRVGVMEDVYSGPVGTLGSIPREQLVFPDTEGD